MKHRTTSVTSSTQAKTSLLLQMGIGFLIAAGISFFCASASFAQSTSQSVSNAVSGVNEDAQIIQGHRGEEHKTEEKSTEKQKFDEVSIENASLNYLPQAFERGGLDKASEHLQILQQTSVHFVDTAQIKKPVTMDKKLQTKPQSNS